MESDKSSRIVPIDAINESDINELTFDHPFQELFPVTLSRTHKTLSGNRFREPFPGTLFREPFPEQISFVVL